MKSSEHSRVPQASVRECTSRPGYTTDKIVVMTGEASHEGTERFAYWSGYTPAKRTADGTMVPLGSDELRSEAARFRRGADRAAADGDAAMAENLRRAADDFDRQAAAPG
jgi:hypothetical protein